MTTTNTPTELIDAVDEAREAVDQDQRDEQTQRRWSEIEEMWPFAPEYSADEADTPLDVPDLSVLSNEQIESVYSRTKVRFFNTCRSSITKVNDGGNKTAGYALDTLSAELKSDMGVHAKARKEAGHGVDTDISLFDAVKSVTGAKAELVEAFSHEIDRLALLAKVGYNCNDVNVKGMVANNLTSKIFAITAGKTAQRATAAAHLGN